MRGYAQFNFPLFASSSEEVRKMGHEVFSPAERDLEEGFDPKNMAGTDQDLINAGFSLRVALGHDLAWITGQADAIVVLPGWEKSNGATAEVAVAKALGLPVWRLVTFLTYGPIGETV